MEKKMSYVSALRDVLAGKELTDAHVEKLEALIASLEKRSAAKSGKPTKTQVENAAIGEAILDVMESGVAYDSNAIKGLIPALAEATPQKIAPLMKKLVEAGSVEVNKVKGKNFYKLVD